MSEDASSSPPPKARILAPVFYPSAFIALFLVACSVFFPDPTEVLFSTAKSWVVQDAGWFTVLTVAGFLVFVVGLAFSNLGRIKLGPDHSTPDYSYSTWFAMLFAAGMGIGLMFFGVAEPIMHYSSPPTQEGLTVGAAQQAMRITFFHWGIHAWAIYAVVALSLAYFSYRHGLPLRIRSSLYPLIGKRIYGPIGHAVDTFAVLGTIFGLATSLGFGVIQINSGLNYLFGIAPSTSTQIILITVITLIATGSVVSGLDRGIRRLSELNMIMAIALLGFVLVMGPTVHLLQVFVQNTGMYISNIFTMTFNLYAYDPKPGWIGGWTLFYWGWWVAWSPFVGMFIARISRGRTVREFVVGVLMVPTGFTFLWMTIYGNTALHLVMQKGVSQLVETVSVDSSVALFEFLGYFPLTSITSLLATLLVVIFFVTSADSGALVIDMLSSEGEEQSPLWQRIFWALLVGAVAIALLLAGGLASLQAATIAAALPFTIVMMIMCWGMTKAMGRDHAKMTSLRNARALPTSDGDWRDRVRALVHQPRRREVRDFLQQTVKPALQDVANELRKRNLDVAVETAEDDGVSLRVAHGKEIDFLYAVRPRPYEPPSFMLGDPRRRNDDSRFFRAEVFLRESGQDYDVMGWGKEELIYDVLDQYQRHIHFLDNIR